MVAVGVKERGQRERGALPKGAAGLAQLPRHQAGFPSLWAMSTTPASPLQSSSARGSGGKRHGFASGRLSPARQGERQQVSRGLRFLGC